MEKLKRNIKNKRKNYKNKINNNLILKRNDFRFYCPPMSNQSAASYQKQEKWMIVM